MHNNNLLILYLYLIKLLLAITFYVIIILAIRTGKTKSILQSLFAWGYPAGLVQQK